MKTNELRKLIKTKLDTVVSSSYYENAPNGALYPHVVFSFRSINLGDFYRDDYMLDVDIWCRRDPAGAESLADSICELFNNSNLPQSGTATFYPTFFRENRVNPDDPDKDINHITLQFQIQNYA